MPLTDGEKRERKLAGNRKYMAKWYKDNPELAKARNRAWAKSHKVERAAASKIYRDANVEKLQAVSKKYREVNKDKISEKKKLYAKNHPEIIKAYKKASYLRNRVLHPRVLLTKKEIDRRRKTRYKIYCKENTEKLKIKHHKRVKDLPDSYVAKIIADKSLLKPKDIPHELIEFKRQSIILKRTIREIQKCKT